MARRVFFAFEADRLWFFEFNSRRFPWGCPQILASVIRKTFHVSDSKPVILECAEEADQTLEIEDEVSLDFPVVQKLFSAPSSWTLKVNRVLLSFRKPELTVADSLREAGIEIRECWTAVMRHANKSSEPIDLSSKIDLTQLGIEKLYYRVEEINNGGYLCELRRDFKIYVFEIAYLRERGLEWETAIERNQRWLISKDFPLPSRYKQSSVDIASNILPNCPGAGIDMLYCYLPLQSFRSNLLKKREKNIQRMPTF